MKTEWRIFAGVTVFLVVAAVVYAWWTRDLFGEVEVIGTTALALSTLLSAMVAFYFLVVARRIEPRPEDRPDAEITEGAGEIGFFSPGSYYPLGIAMAIAVAGLGLVFWMWWLIIAGLVGIVFATCGMLFEYHTGTRRTAAE